VDWPRNILEALLTQIGELNSDLSHNLIVGRRRDADAARFCDALEPCRNIYAIPEDVMRLDNYVADIDAHTESNALVFHVIDGKFVDACLELHSGPNGLDRTGKLRQKPVAGVFDNAAAMVRYCRAHNIRQECYHFGVRSLFVIVHKARIASHVSGQYRRQPPFDPDWLLLHHACCQRELTALEFAWKI
jgi:hypothetical protein